MNAAANTIDTRLVGTWLGLSPEAWPPDHYALLGLTQGESDLERIEQHVHERLARVRCYQLSHPAAVTEVMNRLAQAFLCLSDTSSRQAYNATLNGPCPARKPAVTVKTAALKKPAHSHTESLPPETSTSIPAPTQVDWQSAPPPVRLPAPSAPTIVQPAAEETVVLPPVTPTNEGQAKPGSVTDSGISVMTATPVDFYVQSFQHSKTARRGLGTRRSLYDRILLTRQLLYAWSRVGRYFAKAKRQLTKPIEETDLTRQLAAIDELLPEFPRILGRPGQPGYRVAAMARLETGTLLFRAMDAEQRNALAKDWRAGQRMLLSYQLYLRREIKQFKRQGWLGKAVRAVQSTFRDHKFWIVLAGIVLCLIAGFLFAVLVLR